MSTLDVVAEVLREVAPRALRAGQIAELAGSRLPTASQTPQTVVARDLALDIRDRGEGSRFLRVARGEYVLKHALPIAFYSGNAVLVDQVVTGDLPQGVVDERPIRDLSPAAVAGYRQCHFGGRGTWALALRDGGWPSEWPVWTSVCQSSTAEDHWSEWLRLVWACRPTHLFGEQDAHFSDVRPQLEADGYFVEAFRQHGCFTASRGREQSAAARLAAVQPPSEAAHGHWYNEQLELLGTSDRQQGGVTLSQATSVVVSTLGSLTRSASAQLTWTGPRADEVAPSGMLLGRVPGDRWPHGPPSAHEPRCNLHPHRGSHGGLFCDCVLSDDAAAVKDVL